MIFFACAVRQGKSSSRYVRHGKRCKSYQRERNCCYLQKVAPDSPEVNAANVTIRGHRQGLVQAHLLGQRRNQPADYVTVGLAVDLYGLCETRVFTCAWRPLLRNDASQTVIPRHCARNLRYVAVEGPIGVGKTTLTRRLAKTLGASPVLEAAGDNPFLADFYQRSEINALPAQLHFLMARRQAMQRISCDLDSEDRWVSDFLFSKDRLFASLTLDEKQFALYSQIASELDFDLTLPDLVVYLQAPLEVLYDRIENRGNLFEQSIASSYLARLQRAYTDFFYAYNDTPLLIVNASEIDFARNEHDYDRLVEQIVRIDAGRHYFNPSPETAPAA